MSLAAEIAGAAQAAVAFTVDYVKQRHVFGKPVGVFRRCSIASRNAIRSPAASVSSPCARPSAAARSMPISLRPTPKEHVHKLVFDLHQFNGGMGVTNEHELHFWTYRLRALQAEVGGAEKAALAIADQLWGPVTAENDRG